MPSADDGAFAGFLKRTIDGLPQPPPAYCLIGALAVTAWGHVRSTRDVDLLVLADNPGRTQLIDSLIAHGFTRNTAWIERNPMAEDLVLRLSHPSQPGIPLDLLFAIDDHGQATLAHRRPLHVLGISLWVCSPEDLIILKLKAGRPHDFEDALGIVKNGELQLDLPYLSDWARRLGLHEELQYVRNAAQ